MANQGINCQCCIAGGGPAGLMLGYLLARAGVDVVVLEKHEDFLRDFRGDTIHPSTLEIMVELGLTDKFLKLPHQRAEALYAHVGGQRMQMVNFSHLPVTHKFVAMMPQWDFLNFLAEEGERFPGFNVMMAWEAEDLIFDGERVVGVRGQSNEGPFEVRAPLVVAADGRTSVLRERAGLKVHELGAPIDVLWFKLPRKESDGEEMAGRFQPKQIAIQLNRNTYWQCAFVIAKGQEAALHAEGLPAFRARLAKTLPFEAERFDHITSWDDVKLLTVVVNRLETWYRDGFLAIGDAAHAMSPVGGVGINLAIQDAVVAANLLHHPLKIGRGVSSTLLAKVQQRRLWPTRMIQGMQVAAHNNIIKATLEATDDSEDFLPGPIKVMDKFPFLKRIPARIVGLGVRMEHVAPAIRNHQAVTSQN